MNNKTLSIVSYITLIGWLIAYFSRKDKDNSLLKYHLRQAFGLFIISFVINLALTVVVVLVPSMAFLGYIGYVLFAFLIIGIINASNEVEKPLPVIGKFIDSKFRFIK